MRNKLKSIGEQRVVENSISDAYLIALLIIFPAVGIFMVCKYRKKWIRKPALIVGMTIYTLFIAIGFFLAGSYQGSVEQRDIQVRRLTSEEVIPYKTQTTTDPALVNEGKNGTKQVEYEVKYYNGNEVGRAIINEEITNTPIDAVVLQEGEDE